MNTYFARYRMIYRMLRLDEGEQEEENTEDKKAHGNTRLPYGLCKKYHIDLPDDATPRQAWQALKDKKGISAKEEYAELSNKPTITREMPKYYSPHLHRVVNLILR